MGSPVAVRTRSSGLESRAACRTGIRTVGFVEAGLVNNAARHFFSEPSEGFTDAQIEGVVFELARAGNQKQFVGLKQRVHVVTRASSLRMAVFSPARAAPLLPAPLDG